ncbi:hypothetical protein ACH4A8_13315 [Streptomyces vietnamensis]|uniref:hypothetical protein n=1 Tax=Streptomyces vietnamensis TaxID=362257 RepID=UPI00378BEE6F
MGESVPVRCPECLRTQAYAPPVFPCACGSPVAPPVTAGAAAEPITHRNWADEWVTVRCGACGRASDWPHPELGCPCGTVLRVPVRPADATGTEPGATGGTGAGAGGTAGGVAGTGTGGTTGGVAGTGTGVPRTGAGTDGPGAGRAGTADDASDGRADGTGGSRADGTGGSTGGGSGDRRRPGREASSGGGRSGGAGASGGTVGGAGGRPAGEGPAGGARAVPVEPGSPWFEPGPKARGGADRTGRGADGTGPARPRTFAERYPVRIPSPPAAPRPAPLRGPFRPVTIRTSRDAVAAAAGYLRWLGFRDVVQPEERPSSGVDLRAPGLVAQVDPSTRPTGLRAVECLWLNGLSTATVSVFFSLAGYTPEARSRAAEVGLPLFVLDLTGTPQPINNAADDLAAGGA